MRQDISWVIGDFACVFLSKGSLGRMPMKRIMKTKMRPKVSSYFNVVSDETSDTLIDALRQK